MTKLSAQVKGSLNITTPGVQIWRIEVRILPGHRAGSVGRGWTEARKADCPPSCPAGVGAPGAIPAPSSGIDPSSCSFLSPPSSHPPSWLVFFCALFLALPFPTLRLVKGRHGSWGSWVVKPSDFRSLLRPCRWCLFLPTLSAASLMVTAM